ncbi:MAG: hypothetical protein QNJ30_00405 [Kiloniellales bacterium]|nr:hypothetical protein [Kiloniellales bacterium]
MDEAFSLRVGEASRLEGTELRLHFLEVPMDSRCPKGTACLVAGEAHVLVKAELGSQLEELLFKVPPGGSDTRRFARYSVTVTALEPQTEAERRIETSDYVATLRVMAETP